MKILSYLFIFLLGTSILWADKPMAPYTYVTTSVGGRYYHKMKLNGTGTLYQVTNDNSDVPLWHTSGWYSFRVFLSSDGKYLVRLGNWPSGRNPNKEHVAIAFYENGKLLKSYGTKDLIANESLVRSSVSHYEFMKNGPYLQISYDRTFTLITIDNLEYVFNIKTGEIENKTQQ
jgi:hypothetical protein